MIKNIQYSDAAREVAIGAFNRHIAHRLKRYGFKSQSIEMGALPVFVLSQQQAIRKTWKLDKRRGWRFVCTSSEEKIGAVISVRKQPWKKPKFSGFSIGERAVFHCLAAQEADLWASRQGQVFVARIVRILTLRLEFLCLYKIGSKEPAWLVELTTGATSSDWVNDVALLAVEQEAGGYQNPKQR